MWEEAHDSQAYVEYTNIGGCADYGPRSGWLSTERPYTAAKCFERCRAYQYFTISSSTKKCKCSEICNPGGGNDTSYKVVQVLAAVIYTIKNANSGEYLSVSSGTKSMNVFQSSRPGNAGSQWKLVLLAGGFYTIKNYDTRQYLSSGSSGMDEGSANVSLSSTPESATTHWMFNALDGGKYTIKDVFTGRCLSVEEEGSIAEGASILQRGSEEFPQAQWLLEEAPLWMDHGADKTCSDDNGAGLLARVDGVASEMECKNQCTVGTGGVDCWAVSHHNTTGECRMYGPLASVFRSSKHQHTEVGWVCHTDLAKRSSRPVNVTIIPFN